MNLHPSFTRKSYSGGLREYRFRTSEGRTVRIVAKDYSEAATRFRRSQMKAVP